MKQRPTGMWLSACLCLLLAPLPLFADSSVESNNRQWTMESLLESNSYPFAIGHRGYGENSGNDAERPLENSLESVRRAFVEGVQAVEIDVVLTADGKPVALHDDYLEELGCVNQMSYEALREQLPSIAQLRQILHIARRYSRIRHSERPSGLVMVEIKTPSPRCDPDDSGQQPLTEEVIREIRQSRMEAQVMIESFSPEILDLAAAIAPELPRALAVSAYQFFPPAMIAAYTGLPVSVIDKPSPYGLVWVEAGDLFRAPLYASPGDLLFTLAASSARGSSLDTATLQLIESQGPGMSALLVDQLHQIGLRNLVYTVNDGETWLMLAALGIDGIFTDDIPLGLTLEGIGSTPPVTSP